MYKFFAFFRFAWRIIFLAISQKTGIAIQDRENIAAVLSPEIPKGLNGDKIFAKPKANSLGDVVLANNELNSIKNKTRKAKNMPRLKPSAVILK